MKRIGRVAMLVSCVPLLLQCLPFPALAQEPEAAGVLRGTVVARMGGAPVEGARILVSRALPPRAPAGQVVGMGEVLTDAGGRFEFRVAPGRVDVTVEAFGFETFTEEALPIHPGETTELHVRLEVAPFLLDEIVVTPSTFDLLRDHVVPGQVLSRDELEVRPHLGNDLFRATAHVPGVATYDHTAAPYVRGSRANEVLTILDGLELHEPYHLKQWDGSLSIVDAENVRDVNLTTGGFTTEFGDASAGVLSMRTATPRVQGTRTTLGLDFMSSIARSEGTFAQGKGSWVMSARRGFLDLIFEITGMNEEEDLHPSYYDLYAKAEYQISAKHRVSVHALHAGDDNHGVEDDSTTWNHRYGNSYAWATWSAEPTASTSVRTMASLGRVWRDRNGADYFAPGTRPRVEVRDQATYDFLGLRQDWRHALSGRVHLKAGLDVRWGRADYDYFRWREVGVPNLTDPGRPDFTSEFDNLRLSVAPSGTEVGAYLAGRVQPLPALTVEGGLRLDRQSHTGEHELGPRLNAVYRVAPATNLRGAWGLYHQSHGLDELWVADGNVDFYPAQAAEHRVLGVERILESGIALRAEIYQRLLTHPLPEYRNLEHHTQGLEEEDPDDRVWVQAERGRAQGVEFFAKSTPRSRFAWSVSYALSKVEERIQGTWVPRPFDQRHALDLQATVRPSTHWSMSAGWSYHSPWPYTSQQFSLGRTANGAPYVITGFGPWNQERLIPYQRLDLRISRHFPLEGGDLLVYLDVFNATNRLNAQSTDYSVMVLNGRLLAEQSVHPQLEMMPSLGLRWTF